MWDPYHTRRFPGTVKTRETFIVGPPVRRDAIEEAVSSRDHPDTENEKSIHVFRTELNSMATTLPPLWLRVLLYSSIDESRALLIGHVLF